MKKLVIALVCGIMLMPLSAWGQKWIEPYTNSDGTFVEGHWQTPEDRGKEQNATPGKVNPYTGQFNPYSPNVQGSKPMNPPPMPLNPYQQNPYYPQQDYRYRGY